MAKRKKTIIAGRIVKTVIYTAPEPVDGQRARTEKSRMTTAAQKAMNNKAARARLEMLMAANYSGWDLFVTLTYRDEDLPSSRAEAEEVYQNIPRPTEEEGADAQISIYHGRKARGGPLASPLSY